MSNITLIIIMRILHEALSQYKTFLNIRIEELESIEEFTEEMTEDTVKEQLEKLQDSFNKIDEFQFTIFSHDDYTISVKYRNKLFDNYQLSKDDIVEIKKILRRIKNRHYKRSSREKKTE
jgi:esterase/lipase